MSSAGGGSSTRARKLPNLQNTTVLGIKPWKRWQIDRFLSSQNGRLFYTNSMRAALFSQSRRGGPIVVWAAREPDDLAAAAAAQGAPLWRMEDGFLRSVGLGSNHVGGSSLVLDKQGIYFDPRTASELELLLENGTFDTALLERAAMLRHTLVESGLTKYNFGAQHAPEIHAVPGQRRILVPGQVEDDASLRFGSPQLHSNLELLERVREAEPSAWIVFKPHPDTEAGTRTGAVSIQDAMKFADQIVRGVSVTALFPLVDAVHTMTSLAGFEALLRGISVTTYGAPFYAGWGLTSDRIAIPRRTRLRSIDELTAASLILYPRYVDPGSGLQCEVENLVERLAEVRSSSAQSPLGRSPLRRTARLCTGLIRSWWGAGFGVR